MAARNGTPRQSWVRQAVAGVAALLAAGAAAVAVIEWRTTTGLILDGLVILAASLAGAGALVTIAVVLRPLVTARVAPVRGRHTRRGA